MIIVEYKNVIQIVLLFFEGLLIGIEWFEYVDIVDEILFVEFKKVDFFVVDDNKVLFWLVVKVK